MAQQALPIPVAVLPKMANTGKEVGCYM